MVGSGAGSGGKSGERGKAGELAAARFLIAQGVRILHRNWRCRLGELDLVADDGTQLLFVEVKTRTSSSFGTPAEAVTARKQQRLQRLAAAYLQQAGLWERACRFDVVAVRPARPGPGWDVEWIQDAFR